MIISQTPYGVSFAGGGTDLRAFTLAPASGAVLSAVIDRHIYVTIHRRFEPGIRVSYSRTELAETLDDVRHEIVRETMRMMEIGEPLEITTIGDLPRHGDGLQQQPHRRVARGLCAWCWRPAGPRRLAEQACRIEIDVLGKPIGCQDQYAAAFGGLSFIRFHADGSVHVEPVACREETIAELERWGAGLHRADPRRQRHPRAANGRHRAALPRTPLAARPGPRDAGRPGRIGRSRAVRRAAASGVGDQAIARLRDHQRARRCVVRGGAAPGRSAGSCWERAAAVSCCCWHLRAGIGRFARPWAGREVAFQVARHGSRIIFMQPSRTRTGAGDGRMLVGETASDDPQRGRAAENQKRFTTETQRSQRRIL